MTNQLYDEIRESDTYISDITKNLNCKADNIKTIKDHIFNNKHLLDKYASLGEEPEYQRFDPNLQQALAWKRLQTNVYTPDDIAWIKHEFAEHHHETKFDAGYSESHARAQSRFDSYSWSEN